MNKQRIVLDTNILISGLLLSSCKPQQVFDVVTQNHTLLMSESTLAEIVKTFIRPKFDKYVSLATRLAFIASFKQKAEIIKINESITDCRDPKDNKFLELAVSGNADVLITGDYDLLVLNPFRTIQIVTINEYLTQFTNQNP